MKFYKKKYRLLFIFIFLFISSKYSFALEQKRYVFIDGGAHKGESLLAFQKTALYKKYSWEIFAIEANPYLINDLEKIPNIKVLNNAIWISNEEITFNLVEEDAEEGSVYTFHLKKSKPVAVKAIDFGQWLKHSFSLRDYIIVSFDIVGSEYDVLSKMLKNGTIKYVDRLYVAFRYENISLFKKKEKILVDKLKKLGILEGLDSVEDIIEPDSNRILGKWIDTIEE